MEMSSRTNRHPTRRTFLECTGSAAAALWAGLSQAEAAQPKVQGKAKSVILIFNCGAPSHIDLWDPKPDAPDNIRGEFQTIFTNTAGISVTELLPELAQRSDKLAIVRSVHHEHSSHNSGMHWSIVGQPYRADLTTISPSSTDYPSFGTLTGWLALRDGYSRAVPPYVITPYPHCDSTVYLTPGQYGGCLGVQYDPFVINADPNATDFRVRNMQLVDGLSSERLQTRLGLLQQLNITRQPAADEGTQNYDVRRAQAASMVLSGEAARAFDLSQEPDKVRERYGLLNRGARALRQTTKGWESGLKP